MSLGRGARAEHRRLSRGGQSGAKEWLLDLLVPALRPRDYTPQRMSSKSSVAHGERALTAYHEAGHAIAGYLAFGNAGVVTIRPSGRVLGRAVTERFTDTPNFVEQLSRSSDALMRALGRARAHAVIRVCLAGRASENVFGARSRIIEGDDDGIIAISYINAAYPEGRVDDADGTVTLAAHHYLVLRAEWRRVRALLVRNETYVRAVAKLLLKYETVEGDDWLERISRLPPMHRPLYREDREVLALTPRIKPT